MPNLTMRLPVMPEHEQAGLLPDLREVIEYRKSGLSLNHVIGCPIDCGYCIRHTFGNFEMKKPRALMSDEDAVDALVSHRYFQPGVTPIQFFNRATDPMLGNVKPHTFRVLKDLDNRGLTNNVLVITRWHVRAEDCEFLNSLRHIRLTLLLTHSNISDERIEPIRSTIAANSLRVAYQHAERYRTLLYWRPIVPGLNDSDEDIQRALELSEHAHATVYTGLFYRDQIADYYRAHGLPEPYDGTARRKIFPEELEARILSAFRRGDGTFGKLFRKTSCGVSYAHGLPDYNGHYGIREVCDICPLNQIGLCADALTTPNPDLAEDLAAELGGRLIEVNDRAVVVEGLTEQPRYLMQHSLGYQVHDVAKPHHYRRHGRADIGWPELEPVGAAT